MKNWNFLLVMILSIIMSMSGCTKDSSNSNPNAPTPPEPSKEKIVFTATIDINNVNEEGKTFPVVDKHNEYRVFAEEGQREFYFNVPFGKTKVFTGDSAKMMKGRLCAWYPIVMMLYAGEERYAFIEPNTMVFKIDTLNTNYATAIPWGSWGKKFGSR